MDTSTNRREYYRIDDRIALKLEPMPTGVTVLDPEQFDARRREIGLANHFAANQEQHRSEKKRIEQKHPEIAAYLAYLEEEIQILATRIAVKESGLPTVPTHDVNICAEGLRLDLKECLPAGQFYAVSLKVFPSQTSVFTIGEVLRCDEITEGDDLQKGRFETVIRFEQMDDEDREAVIKHIHQKQMIQLQERQAAANL